MPGRPQTLRLFRCIIPSRRDAALAPETRAPDPGWSHAWPKPAAGTLRLSSSPI